MNKLFHPCRWKRSRTDIISFWLQGLFPWCHPFGHCNECARWKISSLYAPIRDWETFIRIRGQADWFIGCQKHCSFTSLVRRKSWTRLDSHIFYKSLHYQPPDLRFSKTCPATLEPQIRNFVKFSLDMNLKWSKIKQSWASTLLTPRDSWSGCSLISQ